MKRLLSFYLVAGAALAPISCFSADDVSSILKQIKAERVGSASPPKPAPAAAPKKKKSSASQKSSSASQRRSEPKIPVYHPSVKLPKNFAGMRVAGRFALIGTTYEGQPMLVAAEDAMNPFGRQFWIENARSGLGSNVTLPIDQRTLVDVPTSSPLILVKRGVLPGIYWVHLQ